MSRLSSFVLLTAALLLTLAPILPAKEEVLLDFTHISRDSPSSPVMRASACAVASTLPALTAAARA